MNKDRNLKICKYHGIYSILPRLELIVLSQWIFIEVGFLNYYLSFIINRR